MPEPLQRGQTLSMAARIAERMNSDRFSTPRNAWRRAASALKVITICLRGRAIEDRKRWQAKTSPRSMRTSRSRRRRAVREYIVLPMTETARGGVTNRCFATKLGPVVPLSPGPCFGSHPMPRPSPQQQSPGQMNIKWPSQRLTHWVRVSAVRTTIAGLRWPLKRQQNRYGRYLRHVRTWANAYFGRNASSSKERRATGTIANARSFAKSLCSPGCASPVNVFFKQEFLP